MQSLALALFHVLCFLRIKQTTGASGYIQQKSIEGTNFNATYIPPSLNVTTASFSFLPKFGTLIQPSISQDIYSRAQYIPAPLNPTQQPPPAHFNPVEQPSTQQQFFSEQPQFIPNPNYNAPQNTPQNPFTAQPQPNPQQQFASNQPIYFAPSPYIPSQQFYPNPTISPIAQPSAQTPFQHPYAQPTYPKMAPIFIDPRIRPHLYDVPMYMRKRTIQDICAAIAPEERTIIYVLSQNPDFAFDNIDLPPPTKPSKPKVHFIKYKTPEEAELIQKHIQAQYDSLGGSTRVTNEGFAPVSSVEDIFKAANGSIQITRDGY